MVAGLAVIVAVLTVPAAPVHASEAALLCGGFRVTVKGSDAGEVLYGTDGRDVILALGGDDFVYARGNNDVVCGGPGDDYLAGSQGDDVFVADRDSGSAVSDGSDTIHGGAGHDAMSYSGRQWGVRVDLSIPGGDGYYPYENDNIYTDIEEIEGSQGPDSLVGTNNARQTLHGLGGADMIWGDSDDTGNSYDTIYGDDGNDQLMGEGGDDVLYGGAGNDRMWGAAGADAFIETSAPGDGADIFNGGTGRDCASYHLRTDDVYVTLDGQPNDGDAGGLKHPGRENDNVMPDVECVRGSTGHDWIDGRAYPAEPGDEGLTLVGWLGSDTVYGSAGNDVIYGDTVSNDRPSLGHNDHLDGQAGDDHVIGGFGGDAVFGDTGADVLDVTDDAADNDVAEGGNDSDPDTCYGDHEDDLRNCL
jgi:Ca2+-binding RTX toxin-like protein